MSAERRGCHHGGGLLRDRLPGLPTLWASGLATSRPEMLFIIGEANIYIYIIEVHRGIIE